MNKKYLIIVFFICFLFSCKKEKQDVLIITKFPVQENLVASVINIPPINLAPDNIFITDNYLVMASIRKDTIFDFFLLPNCNYQFSAGIKGGGPDDFSTMIDLFYFAPTIKGFNVFFTEKGIYREVEIDKRSKNIYTVNNKRLKFEQLPVQGFHPLGNDRIVYMSGFEKKSEFSIFDSKTNKTIFLSPYPKWTGRELENDRMFTYVKGIVPKPDGEMFAAFYVYFKRWRIYNNEGMLIRDISVKIPPFSSNLLDIDERYVYYGRIFATNNYLYALCKNKKRNESLPEDNTELQVWDWDGNPVALYNLDKYLFCFTIDEKENVLYGVNRDEENEDKIFKYRLPDTF
jgi:hypothetical protein